MKDDREGGGGAGMNLTDPAIFDVFADVVGTYEASDGDRTKELYQRLEALGPAGVVALNLFRAHKNSARAKVYRGGVRGRGSYRSMAYTRKSWALENLCKVLTEHGEALGLTWGWQEDPSQAKHRWVLYVETPRGQVSFHSEWRGDGPAYPGSWDQMHGVGADRICRWCALLLSEAREIEAA